MLPTVLANSLCSDAIPFIDCVHAQSALPAMLAHYIGLLLADYLTKVVVSGKSSAVLSVEEIMTPESVLKTVTPGDTVLAAMELMIENNFRHVPVVRA